MEPYQKVQIHNLPIELQSFLKYEGLVMTGGEAKQVILDGQVQVNAEPETRRGRKLKAGDVVSFNKKHYEIAGAE